MEQAEILGLDSSVASRMVSDNLEAGYLLRAASRQDGLRTVPELSPEGVALMERFREHQRDAYDYITADWEPGEAVEFTRLMLDAWIPLRD